MLLAMMAFWFFPLASSHKLSKCLITVTRKFFSCVSLSAPLMEPGNNNRQAKGNQV